jgi:hypothetical protein
VFSDRLGRVLVGHGYEPGCEPAAQAASLGIGQASLLMGFDDVRLQSTGRRFVPEPGVAQAGQNVVRRTGPDPKLGDDVVEDLSRRNSHGA